MPKKSKADKDLFKVGEVVLLRGETHTIVWVYPGRGNRAQYQLETGKIYSEVYLRKAEE